MGRRGFTLAEIMVCLVLLTIAVLGLIAVQIYSLRAGQGNRERHTASVLASAALGRIEEQVRQDFSSSVAQPRRPHPEAAGYEMQVLETLPDVDLKRVEVHIFWRGKDGWHDYSLWTIFYDMP
ncbi:MAG: prepilin-type N-terminal cleavage/methylation domain-containing protein [Candidatus Eremiobacterota bacterium]